MKVLRRLRSGRRKSKASREANLLLSDPAIPSEGSSDCSWGNESSSLSESTSQLYLVTEYDDNITEASSLPTHVEDLQDADSPFSWGRASTSRMSSRSNSMAVVLYQPPLSPRPLPDSINIWGKYRIASEKLIQEAGCSNVVPFASFLFVL